MRTYYVHNTYTVLLAIMQAAGAGAGARAAGVLRQTQMKWSGEHPKSELKPTTTNLLPGVERDALIGELCSFMILVEVLKRGKFS